MKFLLIGNIIKIKFIACYDKQNRNNVSLMLHKSY